MRFFNIIAAGLALGVNLASAAPTDPTDPTDLTPPPDVDLENPRTIEDFQALALKNLQEAEENDGLEKRSRGCSLANARVRRDW